METASGTGSTWLTTVIGILIIILFFVGRFALQKLRKTAYEKAVESGDNELILKTGLAFYGTLGKTKRLQALGQAYQSALQGTDKQFALGWGRAYKQLNLDMHKKKKYHSNFDMQTIEQELSNDVQSMRTA
jgi:hypothetical protein